MTSTLKLTKKLIFQISKNILTLNIKQSGSSHLRVPRHISFIFFYFLKRFYTYIRYMSEVTHLDTLTNISSQI